MGEKMKTFGLSLLFFGTGLLAELAKKNSGMTEWAQLMDLWGDIIQNEKQSFDTVVRKRNMPIANSVGLLLPKYRRNGIQPSISENFRSEKLFAQFLEGVEQNPTIIEGYFYHPLAKYDSA